MPSPPTLSVEDLLRRLQSDYQVLLLELCFLEQLEASMRRRARRLQRRMDDLAAASPRPRLSAHAAREVMEARGTA